MRFVDLYLFFLNRSSCQLIELANLICNTIEDNKAVAYAAASHLPGRQFRVAANKTLSMGPSKLRFEFTRVGEGGVVTIAVNGSEVSRQTITSYPHMMAVTSETFDIGRDANSPVSDGYRNEGVFTGDIKRVQVDMKMPSAGP